MDSGGVLPSASTPYLLLDRALYLESQGYRVRLGRFCPEQLSPRNLLQAERD